MSTYYNLKVKEVRPQTAEAVQIIFENPAEGMEYQSGQFLTVICEIDGKEERRSYSLCSSPYVDADPSIAVKRVSGGKMSNFLNDSAQAGQTIRVMKPMGHFATEVSPNAKRHVVLLGGGSGITPLLGIAKSVLTQEPQSHVSLLYANRDEANIIFAQELKKLEGEYGDRFTVVHTLDNPPAGWTGSHGLLTPPTYMSLVKQLPDHGVHNTEYFVCGPTGLMDLIFASLDGLGIPHDRVKKEVFSNDLKKDEPKEPMANDSVVEDPNQTYEVTIVLDGEEYTFEVEPGYSILETALDLDIDMPYSCQSGLCTACRGKLLSGKVEMEEMEGLSDDEIEEGYVLNCVGHPVTPGVKIEIG